MYGTQIKFIKMLRSCPIIISENTSLKIDTVNDDLIAFIHFFSDPMRFASLKLCFMPHIKGI